MLPGISHCNLYSQGDELRLNRIWFSQDLLVTKTMFIYLTVWDKLESWHKKYQNCKIYIIIEHIQQITRVFSLWHNGIVCMVGNLTFCWVHLQLVTIQISWGKNLILIVNGGVKNYTSNSTLLPMCFSLNWKHHVYL